MRTLMLVLITGVVLMAGAPAQARDCKIGLIDVPRILEEYEGYKERRKSLDEMRTSREAEFKKRATALQREERKLQESLKMLSEAKREEKVAEFRRKAQELEKWRMAQNKELADREEGMLKRLESDVRKSLEKIGKKGKYSFVVRRDLMLYTSPDAKDLTDKVLADLRKSWKKSK